MQRPGLGRRAAYSAGAAAVPRSQPDSAGVCFAAPRTHPLPYASSAPALSSLDDDRAPAADDGLPADDCYARTLQRLRLCIPRSKPIPVPRARPRAPRPLATTPPLPDARPIVSRFLRREEARRRGEPSLADPFVEWAPAADSVPLYNPFALAPADAHDAEIVPGRPPREDAGTRQWRHPPHVCRARARARQALRARAPSAPRRAPRAARPPAPPAACASVPPSRRRHAVVAVVAAAAAAAAAVAAVLRRAPALRAPGPPAAAAAAPAAARARRAARRRRRRAAAAARRHAGALRHALPAPRAVRRRARAPGAARVARALRAGASGRHARRARARARRAAARAAARRARARAVRARRPPRAALPGRLCVAAHPAGRLAVVRACVCPRARAEGAAAAAGGAARRAPRAARRRAQPARERAAQRAHARPTAVRTA
ncbi:hypothetical protein FGB62_25g69 [Gracilaria domingensis]|nr:hypothetical protein FGB62_25g69 [Gracilaria domingensis]